MELHTGRGTGGSLPHGNGLRGEPERQTAVLLKAIFVLRPVCDWRIWLWGYDDAFRRYVYVACVRILKIHDHCDITLAIRAPTPPLPVKHSNGCYAQSDNH